MGKQQTEQAEANFMPSSNFLIKMAKFEMNRGP